MFDAHRRYGRNQPPIATLESYLAHFGFAQQHVLRLRLARHPVADIRLVVHRDAARARPSARNSDAAADPIPIWVFSRTPRRDVETSEPFYPRYGSVEFKSPNRVKGGNRVKAS
jgi:hypothetical protein